MARPRLNERTLNIPGAVLVTVPEAPGVEVYTYESNGKLCAYGYKSARQLRHNFHNQYRSEEQRQIHIREFFNRHKDMANYRQKKKENTKLPNPYKPGDLLVCTWGYDQTNQDFYQVTEAKGRSVTIREVANEVVKDNAEGYSDPSMSMAEYVVGRRDKFIGEPMTKRVLFDDNGNAYIQMNSYSAAKLWDGRKKYQSHYA